MDKNLTVTYTPITQEDKPHLCTNCGRGQGVIICAKENTQNKEYWWLCTKCYDNNGE